MGIFQHQNVDNENCLTWIIFVLHFLILVKQFCKLELYTELGSTHSGRIKTNRHYCYLKEEENRVPKGEIFVEHHVVSQKKVPEVNTQFLVSGSTPS